MSPPAATLGGTPVREALDSAATAIAAGGCATPRLDAELLVAHVLGVARERLLTAPELNVSGPAVRALQAAVRRRAVDREPLAYITGVRAFRRVQLAVDRRALIPRPETELLVEAALSLERRASVLDVCTGAGAVALALKDERPDLRVSGSDISAPALALARENAKRLGLEVEFLHADLLGGLADRYDAILANPPYVAESERAQLAPEIVAHEPPQALFAGADGLEVIRALCAQLPRMRRARLAALEIGAGQSGAAGELLRAAGFENVRTLADLAGIERVVVARAPETPR
jgi:release factor glutamine methyltransferase